MTGTTIVQPGTAGPVPADIQLPPAVLLPWYGGVLLAAGLLGAAFLLTWAPTDRIRRVAPVAREAALVAAIYSLWSAAGSVGHHAEAGAFDRARWIDRAERFLQLPSERALQPPLLDHPWWGQAANLYYASVHLPSMGILLAWVFWRHRDRYPRIRTGIAAYTLLATSLQFIGVAPPRLLPELGYADVAAAYHQSMYTPGAFGSGALQAMPSEHMGWAVLIALAVIEVGRTPRRWLILAHPVITLYVVTATGNHWWFDSAASGLIICVVIAARRFLRVLMARRRAIAAPSGALSV